MHTVGGLFSGIGGIELGFEQVGFTSLKNGKLEIEISRNEQAKNILYAFIHKIGEDEINWQVMYIGHTRKSLKNRMVGYRLGNGQATNNRVHNHLKSMAMLLQSTFFTTENWFVN